MDVIYILGFAAIALFLLAAGAFYFYLYKRNINKALTPKSATHIRMVPPYKVYTEPPKKPCRCCAQTKLAAADSTQY